MSTILIDISHPFLVSVILGTAALFGRIAVNILPTTPAREPGGTLQVVGTVPCFLFAFNDLLPQPRLAALCVRAVTASRAVGHCEPTVMWVKMLRLTRLERTVQIAYCANCQKYTGHKRNVGVGTAIGAVVTGGATLLAVPAYGKRCVVCGLTVGQATELNVPPTPDEIATSQRGARRKTALIVGTLIFLPIAIAFMSAIGWMANPSPAKYVKTKSQVCTDLHIPDKNHITRAQRKAYYACLKTDEAEKK